jgi:hypothetical protein
MLFEGDAIVEAVVPDLTLVGMLAAVQVLKERAERGEDDEAQRDGEGP